MKWYKGSTPKKPKGPVAAVSLLHFFRETPVTTNTNITAATPQNNLGIIKKVDILFQANIFDMIKKKITMNDSLID